jgi:predicted amidophosphoribosyltransferase
MSAATAYTTAPGVCGGCGGPCQPYRAICAKCERKGRAAAKAATVLPEPAPVTAHQGSPYRCRSHHGVHVDRRGRGCPLCGVGP